MNKRCAIVVLCRQDSTALFLQRVTHEPERKQNHFNGRYCHFNWTHNFKSAFSGCERCGVSRTHFDSLTHPCKWILHKLVFHLLLIEHSQGISSLLQEMFERPWNGLRGWHFSDILKAQKANTNIYVNKRKDLMCRSFLWLTDSAHIVLGASRK